jgi:hypothetical protein
MILNRYFQRINTADFLFFLKKYSVCDRYGVSLSCRIDSCSCHFNLPCAQSSGYFFSHAQLALHCPQHLDFVVLTCKLIGSICHSGTFFGFSWC